MHTCKHGTHDKIIQITTKALGKGICMKEDDQCLFLTRRILRSLTKVTLSICQCCHMIFLLYGYHSQIHDHI